MLRTLLKVSPDSVLKSMGFDIEIEEEVAGIDSDLELVYETQACIILSCTNMLNYFNCKK